MADGGDCQTCDDLRAGRQELQPGHVVFCSIGCSLAHRAATTEPIPMILICPMCHVRHIDAGEFATKAHHTHACQSCGNVWRPAIVPTVGVQFLPGFKDEPAGAAP